MSRIPRNMCGLSEETAICVCLEKGKGKTLYEGGSDPRSYRVKFVATSRLELELQLELSCPWTTLVKGTRVTRCTVGV